MLEHIQGVPVFMADAQDPPIRTEQDALDLIIAAGHYGAGADWAAIPAGRFEAEFFELSTRIAGGIVQKFVSYQMGFAMIGDISRYTSGSESLAAFVRESNRGRHVWFVSDVDELAAQLDRVSGVRRDTGFGGRQTPE
jgi:hypothetical protein